MGNIGIFEVLNTEDTFRMYMPQIANFFLKDHEKVFLIDQKGRMIHKDFKIWETLIPFTSSKMKGTMPSLKLVGIGGWKESEIKTDEQRVSPKIITIR